MSNPRRQPRCGQRSQNAFACAAPGSCPAAFPTRTLRARSFARGRHRRPPPVLGPGHALRRPGKPSSSLVQWSSSPHGQSQNYAGSGGPASRRKSPFCPARRLLAMPTWMPGRHRSTPADRIPGIARPMSRRTVTVHHRPRLARRAAAMQSVDPDARHRRPCLRLRRSRRRSWGWAFLRMQTSSRDCR